MAIHSILVTKLGFTEVIDVATLDEAVERLGEAPAITLAVFDAAVTGFDSPACLSAVRECSPETLVAVVSDSEKREDILMALGAGVHGYVPKRLGPTELIRAIGTLLQGEMYVPISLASVAGPTSTLQRTAPDPCTALTPRQSDVLALLVQGRSNKEIARLLGLGEGTVKIHIAALFRTLGVSNRAAAAVVGVQLRSHLAAAPVEERRRLPARRLEVSR